MIWDNPFEPDEGEVEIASQTFSESQAQAASEHIYINFPYEEMPELSKPQEIYLNHLMCCGDIAAAAIYSGISPLQTMTWSLNQAYLLREMQVATLLGMMATDKARYVGMYGNAEPVFDRKGKITGYKRVRDTRLLAEVAKNFDRRWAPAANDGMQMIEASSTPRVAQTPTPSGFLPSNGR